MDGAETSPWGERGEKSEVEHATSDEQTAIRNQMQAHILDVVRDGVIAIDGEHRILYLNNAMAHIVGVEPKEAIGKPFTDFYRFRWPEPDDEAAARAGLAERGRWRGDIILMPHGGHEIQAEFTVSETGERGLGNVWRIAIVRDVSERRMAEQALRESERRFHVMADAAPVLIWLSEQTRGRTYFNEGWLRFTGRTMAQELGHGWLERVHADDLERCLRIYTTGFDAREEFKMEYQLLRHDGVYRWVLDHGTPRFTPDGAFAGYIGSCIDITEQVEARDEVLRRARQQAAVAELGFFALENPSLQDLFDRAVTIVCETLDLELCEVLELQADGGELLMRAGRGWKEGIVSVATISTGADSQAGYTLSNGKPVFVADLRTEERFSGPSLLTDHGVVSGLSVTIRLDGEPYGVMGAHTKQHHTFTQQDGYFLQAVANVVGEAIRRKRAEEALHEAMKASEAAAQAKSAFLAQISHDLRTPLTAIVGFAELLDKRPDKQGIYQDRILKSARRLKNTIDAMLDFVRLEGQAVTMKARVLNIGNEARELVQEFELRARQKNLALHLDTPEEPVEAYLDSTAFDRVLTNLIGNAIKFTEEGEIRVTVEGDENTVTVHVADTGIGIGKAFLPHVFDVFEQESQGDTRAFEGSGLGLAIAKRLVEAMGGTIEVKSLKGTGTTFSVRFPRVSSVTATQAETTKAQTTLASTSRRLLIVEDQDDAREMLGMLLEVHYDVTLADGVEVALAHADNEAFDLFLFDVNLSGEQTGVDLLQILRAKPEHATTPAIACTAYAMPEDEKRFRDAGFSDYVSKPFTFEEVLDVIARVLADR